MEQKMSQILEQQIQDQERIVEAALQRIEEQQAAQEQEQKDQESRGLFHKKKKPPALPQNDEDPTGRKDWLEKNREKYQYDHEYLPPLPMIDSVPEEENFSTAYKLKRGLKSANFFADIKLARLKKIVNPPKSVDSFADLFKLMPQPTSAQTWRTDDAFAEQRLSGANPMMLNKVTTWSQMPFKVGTKSTKIPGYSVTYGDAVKQGKLYYTDYSDMSFAKGIPDLKYLPTPKAIFFWSTQHSHAIAKQLIGFPGHGQLLPLAIQVKKDDPIYTPTGSDPNDWLLAKFCVQIADANNHQLGPHLTHTHFVMEPFAIATGRQLAENHPLGLLLRPHFRFLLVNNEAGRTSLIVPGGPIDKLFGGTLEESLKIVTNEYKSWSLKSFSFLQHIKNRGLDDEETLPHYPYRDDGKLIWNAISKFAGNYVKHYYKNNKAITEDVELRAWAGELASSKFGRVKEMPKQIKTRFELIDILTTIIFTCSGQHSAVNFSQYDYMATIPNMPAAAYCPFVKTDIPKTDDDLLKFLPPGENALQQVEVVAALTAYHYDRLGFYDKHDFEDKTINGFITQFQQELDLVEKRIDVRNTRRDFNYKFLKPSEILNSISI